jgi:hypothetical protein
MCLNRGDSEQGAVMRPLQSPMVPTAISSIEKQSVPLLSVRSVRWLCLASRALSQFLSVIGAVRTVDLARRKAVVCHEPEPEEVFGTLEWERKISVAANAISSNLSSGIIICASQPQWQIEHSHIQNFVKAPSARITQTEHFGARRLRESGET